MVRRVVAIILVVLAISIATMSVVLAVNIHQSSQITVTPTPILLTPTPTPKPTPVLTPKGKPPTITATEAILLDADTGNILVNINGEKPLPMASTTKIMTAIIAIQAGNLDQLVTIHQDAVNEWRLHDGSNAQLVAGDKLTLRQLLYALLLPSGDDAAIAIADDIAGSPGNFVNLMNLFAYKLHLFQTHYVNPDGLTYYLPNGKPNSDHYTTAYDLVRLARYAMSIPLFAQIVKTQKYIVPPTGTNHAYTWSTTNTLLGTYQGMTGIKTGFTVEAGECLVFSATRNGHDLIGVVLHSGSANTRFTDSEALLNWGFALPLLLPSP